MYGNDLTQGERKTLTRVTHYQFYLSIISAMQPTIHTAYIISLLHGKGLKLFTFQHSVPVHLQHYALQPSLQISQFQSSRGQFNGVRCSHGKSFTPPTFTGGG